MPSNSHFRPGSAVYICQSCGKRTRETGDCESNVGLCAYCYAEAGLENEHADGHITDLEFDEAIKSLKIIHNRA